MPTTGWQITMIIVELLAFLCFAYLLLKKVRSKHPYTHFEGKLYWAAVLVLLFNFILYFYGI